VITVFAAITVRAATITRSTTSKEIVSKLVTKQKLHHPTIAAVVIKVLGTRPISMAIARGPFVSNLGTRVPAKIVVTVTKHSIVGFKTVVIAVGSSFVANSFG